MKSVFSEAALKFKVLQKTILNYQQEITRAKKAAKHEEKKAVAAAAKAHGHSRGARGGRRGTRRGMRGRHMVQARNGMDDPNSNSEPVVTTESSGSSSGPDSKSEAEVTIPRSCQQQPVWV